MLPEWNELPEEMKNDYVLRYYNVLKEKENSLRIKRAFDIVMSSIMIVLLLPVFVIIAIMIKRDSEGEVFYKQTRVTTGNRDFTIYKFRTMVSGADKIGPKVTVGSDMRVTAVGEKLRKYRLDELPQLFNVLKGDMSFVGTRPEVRKYVDAYTPSMMATLLLPAGITSLASIKYKDEATLLENAVDADDVYIRKILPEKMKYNLKSLRRFSCMSDLATMIYTVISVL